MFGLKIKLMISFMSNTASIYFFLLQVGATPNINYIASGGSDDWARGEAGIKWVYLLELPDRGFYGFLLPPRKIISTAKSVFQGFRAGLAEINSFGYQNNYYNTVIR